MGISPASDALLVRFRGDGGSDCVGGLGACDSLRDREDLVGSLGS